MEGEQGEDAHGRWALVRAVSARRVVLRRRLAPRALLLVLHLLAGRRVALLLALLALLLALGLVLLPPDKDLFRLRESVRRLGSGARTMRNTWFQFTMATYDEKRSDERTRAKSIAPLHSVQCSPP